MTQLWEKIPSALRYVSQWCIAAPDKSPYSSSGFRASVVDHNHWTDWYSASAVAATWGEGAGIGFVLAEGDGFACIDLDVKDNTPPEELERYQKIIDAFDSYTERSRSGKGYHIWVKGHVGAGCRRGGVEIYSQQRFIICTGNVVRDQPVESRQAMLDMLVSDIRRIQEANSIDLVESDETESDTTILDRATGAENGAKFSDLWRGDWIDTYPSQSEADLSLLSILTFYSKSNVQVRRLFRLSGLGRREKATRNDKYLDRTLGLIRGRQARDVAVLAHGEAVSIQLVSHMEKQMSLPKLIPVDIPVVSEWPPGPVGEIAKWLYSIAPRPVREVAIISALGIFAGCYGRAYNISNTGLNLYLVLVARSAVGKEAIHSGISKLVNGLMLGGIPQLGNHIDFSDYASGPALIKALAERTSFVNIAGEWGRKLRKMGDDHTEGPMSSLRTVMTNLYQKSSAGTIVGGIGYSDKEKDVKSVDGVAYSMIGETTPETFYESLTNTMMQDGFMSRFIVLEYTGFRPSLNTMMDGAIPEWFLPMMANTFDHTARLLPGQFFDVPMNPEARRLLDDFNLKCDSEINGTEDESWRQMWNRAHLKALKVGAILAVAKNFQSPIMVKEDAEWALGLIHRDIRIMSRKMIDGDVGDGDMVRERKVLSIISKYLKEPISSGYRIPDIARQSGVVTRKYLQIKTQQVNSFTKGSKGASETLDKTVRSLMDSGYLVEISRDKIPSDWGAIGRCYRILSIPEVGR